MYCPTDYFPKVADTRYDEEITELRQDLNLTKGRMSHFQQKLENCARWSVETNDLQKQVAKNEASVTELKRRYQELDLALSGFNQSSDDPMYKKIIEAMQLMVDHASKKSE